MPPSVHISLFDRDLHPGANAVVGHHVDRATTNARGLDLAGLGHRRDIAVAAVVAQQFYMGEYLSSGLHARYPGLDRTALAGRQRHAGCLYGHCLRIGRLLCISAGDGVDRGAALSNVGLVAVDRPPGSDTRLVRDCLFQPRDLVS